VRLALRNKNGVRTGYAGTTVKQLIGLIAALRDAADGQPGTQDAPLAKLVPADANGIAYVRSVSGVLRIVYLGGINRGGELAAAASGQGACNLLSPALTVPPLLDPQPSHAATSHMLLLVPLLRPGFFPRGLNGRLRRA
jgi:hypothetical protein